MKDGTFTPEREGTLSAAPPCPGPAKGPGVGVGQCQALGDLCLECPRLSGPNPFNGSEAQGFSVTLGKEPPHPHPPVLDKAARGVRTGPAVALSLPREQSARRGSPERSTGKRVWSSRSPDQTRPEGSPDFGPVSYASRQLNVDWSLFKKIDTVFLTSELFCKRLYHCHVSRKGPPGTSAGNPVGEQGLADVTASRWSHAVLGQVLLGDRVLTREESVRRQRGEGHVETAREDDRHEGRGRGWRGVPTSRGAPATAESRERQGGLAPEPAEGARPCRQLAFGLLASGL